jgi:hypothetical protein
VYNTFSYTYVHLLVLISYRIAQRTVMDHLTLKRSFSNRRTEKGVTILRFLRTSNLLTNSITN